MIRAANTTFMTFFLWFSVGHLLSSDDLQIVYDKLNAGYANKV